MSKINLLTADVYNKISAGEVVERPSSVVKELTENAIDAGATSIKITVKNGGIKYINVTDNGVGIPPNELSLAFLRHSTSKIKTENDLNAIKTLGFRGEALASIAAVSKVTAISKIADNPIGYCLSINGGECGEINESGANNGTSITIEDLFYNTPARLKFLKKPAGETSEITNTVSRLILANPNIAIKYTVENDVVFNSQGSGIENAFYCVYGADALTNCIPLETTYKEYAIKGFISSLSYTKSNSTYQTLVINGRYVFNNTVTTAVKIAYKPYLMVRQYPMFLLYMTIPYDEIDVNVHPNKLDVRFVDHKAVFSAFYSTITRLLKNEETRVIAEIRSNQNVYTDNKVDANFLPSYEYEEEIAFKGNIAENNIFTTETVSNSEEKENLSKNDDVAVLPDNFDAIFNNSDLPPAPTVLEKLFQKQQDTNSFLEADLIKKGSLFDTYLIFEDRENKCMYFIDQHAAHERLIFDRLQKEYESSKLSVQPLLVPYIFEVNSEEEDFINNNLSLFRNFGFEITAYGNRSFRIDTVPYLLSNINLDGFIRQTLGEIENGNVCNSFTRDFLARTACKHAIKAGEAMNEAQIDTIITMLRDNTAMKCPHGRPIVVKITQNEIEKWFKRIV